MTPSQWNEILHKSQHWKDAYAAVNREARLILDPVPRDSPMSTSELVEALYPVAFSRGEGINARNRLYAALASLAVHDLADCCHRGAPTKRVSYGGVKIIHPWVWHTAGTANTDSIERKRKNYETKYQKELETMYLRIVERLGRDDADRMFTTAMMAVQGAAE